MKKCFKCQETKPLSEFSKNKGRKDGHNPMCKSCMREYDKTRFANMGKPERQKRNKARTERSRRNSKFRYDYLLRHPCVDCGETDPIVLEFDHVRGEKKINLSDMDGSYSIKLIEEEIAKCEVRCANCHKRKTAKQFGYYNNFNVA